MTWSKPETRILDPTGHQARYKNYAFIAFLTHKASSKLYVFLFFTDLLYFIFLVEYGLHKIKCTQLITLLKVQTFKQIKEMCIYQKTKIKEMCTFK